MLPSQHRNYSHKYQNLSYEQILISRSTYSVRSSHKLVTHFCVAILVTVHGRKIDLLEIIPRHIILNLITQHRHTLQHAVIYAV